MTGIDHDYSLSPGYKSPIDTNASSSSDIPGQQYHELSLSRRPLLQSLNIKKDEIGHYGSKHSKNYNKVEVSSKGRI